MISTTPLLILATLANESLGSIESSMEPIFRTGCSILFLDLTQAEIKVKVAVQSCIHTLNKLVIDNFCTVHFRQ